MKTMTPMMKQTLLYGSSIALMKGISLLMLPFITHHLPQAEFGKLEIVSSIAALGSILVGLGLEDALYRFVGGQNDANERKRMAARIFTLTLIVGAFVVPAGWMLAAWLDAHVPGGLSTYQLRLVLLMLALEGCIAVPLGWLRMQNRATAFFTVAVGRALFHAGLTVVMLLMGRGIDGVLEAGVIAAVMQAIILTALQLKDTGFGFSKDVAKQSLIYSLPIMASGLMAFSLNGLDRWVLADVASLEDVAQFGVAAKFALAVVLLLQPFGMWWMPKRFDILYGQNGRENATRYTNYGLTLGMIIAVVVAFSAPVAIHFLLPESYMMAAQFTALLIAAALFKEIAELINLGSYAGETSYAQLAINAISAVVAFATLWLWGAEYGVFGILAALAFTQGLRMIMFFCVSQHLYYLPYPVFSLLVMLTFSLVWLSISQFEWSLFTRIVLTALAPMSVFMLAHKLGIVPPLSLQRLRGQVA
ncbi:oligosaccharide translocase [Enterovibrio norvegicus]|nr:oligosaccharide translocase [Enterovibrio norvegicus]OEF60992.1 oligosaccharide translocase [Enterovibrio norvegicus]PMH60841.1 oligosaccharide translocase [Enterovibrio norvegicus]PMI35821.1 oligosaccharide translocase [Enterovibrio norvegicus]PMN56815.1 oligosaccharide translocase [Enterovibrio norvegicus]